MIKNFLRYVSVLVIFIGLFSPIAKVHAQSNNDCFTQALNRNGDGNAQRAEEECINSTNQGSNRAVFLTCTLGTNPKLQHLLIYVTCIISTSVIPLIFALALVMFIWGVVQYVINSDEEAKKAKGKQFMIWGIIALTVMVSVWGLVALLGNTFGIDAHFIPQVKPIPQGSP